MQPQEISAISLDLQLVDCKYPYVKSLMEGEVAGINIEHVAISSKARIDFCKAGYKTIYLFLKGEGVVSLVDADYTIVPETIFLPNNAKSVTIKPAGNGILHYLKIASELTAQDREELINFPAENTQFAYCAKFMDCQSYVEPIKSPNTVSRTILPNKIIPRIAMGTVQTKGPDEVGAHEHPMLEQLFLGLAKNNCVVYADDAKISFPEHTLLHIPLGSRHSVSVAEDEILHYVWMDFFLDSKGEEWLNTHIVEDKD